MERNSTDDNEVKNPQFPVKKSRTGRNTTYLRHVPRDMTMKRPHARIIRLILKHEMPARPQHLYITTLRVLHVRKGNAVPVARAFVENGHVVAVEVKGLGSVSTGIEVNRRSKQMMRTCCDVELLFTTKRTV